MTLAFLIDQIQELCCGLFDKDRYRVRSKITFWERVRSLFPSYFRGAWLDGHAPRGAGLARERRRVGRAADAQRRAWEAAWRRQQMPRLAPGL